MISVTGDIHGNPNRFSSDNFPIGKELTKEDYVIILGDFGLIWNKDYESRSECYWLNWLDKKPWTTLFICGNHENYDRINQIPKEIWHGGLVRKVRPSVINLCYGHIFTINGKTFASLGGASSHDIEHGIIDPADFETHEDMIRACKNIDKLHGGWQFARYRIKGLSWWEEEVPSTADRIFATLNLNAYDNTVDFVLSHEGPASDVALIGNGAYKPDEYSIWLENLRQELNYNKWYFGHYHVDRYINLKERVLFKDIIQID